VTHLIAHAIAVAESKLSSSLLKKNQRKTRAVAPTDIVTAEKKNNSSLLKKQQGQQRQTRANGTLLPLQFATVVLELIQNQHLRQNDDQTTGGGCPVRRQLQIIHSSDNESSFIDPNTLEAKINHYATVVNGLTAVAEAATIPSIHVTAGDHTIPGPFYEAAAEAVEFGHPGLADIAIFNAMGLDGNGIGTSTDSEDEHRSAFPLRMDPP
jgi:hypothetical protein